MVLAICRRLVQWFCGPPNQHPILQGLLNEHLEGFPNIQHPLLQCHKLPNQEFKGNIRTSTQTDFPTSNIPYSNMTGFITNIRMCII